MGFGAYLGNYFPGRIVEVHFAADEPAKQAQYVSLGILAVIGAAIAIPVALIGSKGIGTDRRHNDCDMQKLYPIQSKLAQSWSGEKAGHISCKSIAWGPLPLASSCTSKLIFVPSFNSGIPDFWTAVTWTNMSLPPPSGVTKP